MSLAAMLGVLSAAFSFLSIGILLLVLMVLPFFAGVISVLSLFFVVTACLCVDSARKARQEAQQLPYVPPVTADTLPAEEVLVRGSEEPTQDQGKVLLRGAQSDQEASAEQLLRSSQGQEQRP